MALREASVKYRAVLMPHAQIIAQAKSIALGVRAHLEHLRNTGALREFNSEYRRRRTTAESNGEGFMSYATAELRLRRFVLSRLIGGRKVEFLKTAFEEIFGGSYKSKNIPADSGQALPLHDISDRPE